MDRKLASIQLIKAIDPIEGADRIERLSVLGWYCVAKKGDFKVNDRIVFIEPDAVVPPRPEFDFLKESNYRIKTRKFRRQVSQGVCFPLSILPMPIIIDVEFGDDVTECLGIKKYEPYIPAHLAGQVKGNFPEFIHKTDEDRIQTAPDVLARHKGKICYVTEKIDGISMTVYFKDGIFGVCSRNLDLKETEDNTYWKVARELNLEKKLRFLPARSDPYTYDLSNVALQGELIGQGVQKNKYGLSGLEYRIFNVWDTDTQAFLNFKDFTQFVVKLGLQTVPVVETVFVLNHTVEQLVQLSQGQSLLNKNTPREGLIFRPLQEEYDPELGRLSFKVINPNFLLKFDSE